MAGETNKTQEQEDLEAADAVAKAARTKTAPDVIAAGKEVAEALWMRFAGKWGWKPLLAAVVTTALAIGTIIGTRHTPEEVKVAVKEAVQEVKEDPKPSVPQADLAKMMSDGFANQNKLLVSLVGEVKKLADKKPEPLPQPKPVDPDNKPKPKVLSLPETVTVTVGGGAMKLKATAPSEVQWHWKATDGFSIDRHGDVLYIEASKEGSMIVIAYTTSKDKVMDFAASMVTTLKAPIPPPGPIPPPPGPNPTPVSLDELGKLVLTQALKPGRKDDAAKLAEVYERVVSRMAQGSVSSVGQAVQELFDGNTSAIGRDNLKYWAGFFAWADNELTRRAELGKLTTLEQNRVAFAQIGAALREASK